MFCFVQHEWIWIGFHNCSMTSIIVCFSVCAFFFCLRRKPHPLLCLYIYIYIYKSLLCEGKSWKHGATPAWMPMGQALPSISASIVASDRNSMEKHWSLSFCAQLTLPGRDLSSQTYVLTWSARKFLLHYSKAYRPLVAELFEFAKKLATIAEAKEQSIYSNH